MEPRVKFGADGPLLAGGLALALGSGGARGFAHIGVLQVLEEQGIRPLMLAGSSVGAVIGGLWAAGYSASEIETIATSTTNRELFQTFMDPPWPLPTLDPFEERLRTMFAAKGLERIEDFPIPFVAVSADLVSGETVTITGGDPALAVRASGSLPGIFGPLALEGRQLVDGVFGEPVPWQTALEFGADSVFAVDVSFDSSRLQPLNWLYRALESDLMTRLAPPPTPKKVSWFSSIQRSFLMSQQAWGNRYQLPEQVHYLRVDSPVSWFNFRSAQEPIALGRELATRALLDWDSPMASRA